MKGYHCPVLLTEVIKALDIKAGEWYIDCTLGDGGHSVEIIKRGGKVVGIDVDPEALVRALKRFRDEGIEEDRFKLVLGNFRDIKNLIIQTETKFAGVIFDLGVSSLQLETPNRGFSFMKEGSLDMRMDPGLNVKALDLVNNLTRKELYELFSKMGEEKYSWAVADAVVRAREVKQITLTVELADLVMQVYRKAGIRDLKTHPATRIFQALRMVINSELGALEEGLEQVRDLVGKNARIVVISFHSLEDRIAKNIFKKWQYAGIGEVITKKIIVPGYKEIEDNPRSRSAKMRLFKKL